MKKFLRENPTIAFGLGLPLVLVIVFLIVSGLPTLLVSDPQYDVLYATDYYDYPEGLQISVVGEKVQIIFQGPMSTTSRKPKIWRYNPNTGAVKEIAIVLPSGIPIRNQNNSNQNNVNQEIESITTVISLPDLEGLTVDSSSIAPDGYEFTIGQNRYSRNLFGDLFYSARYRNEAVLSKSGRQIRLPNTSAQYYGYNPHFIGWVVSP